MEYLIAYCMECGDVRGYKSPRDRLLGEQPPGRALNEWARLMLKNGCEIEKGYRVAARKCSCDRGPNMEWVDWV